MPEVPPMKLSFSGSMTLGKGSRLGPSRYRRLLPGKRHGSVREGEGAERGPLSLVLPRAAPDHPIIRLAMCIPQPAPGALRNATPDQYPGVTHVYALHKRQGKLTHLLDGTVTAGSKVGVGQGPGWLPVVILRTTQGSD